MSDDFTLPDDAHAVIRQGLTYWRAAAPGPGLLPGRQHIDPLGMPSLLPYLAGCWKCIRRPAMSAFRASASARPAAMSISASANR